MSEEKKPGIPVFAGEIVGGLTGAFIGYAGSEKLVDLALDKLNLDIPPAIEDGLETALCVGAGAATSLAAVVMARKDPNLAIFHGARIAAGIGAANIAVEMHARFTDMGDKLAAIDSKLADLDPSHQAPSQNTDGDVYARPLTSDFVEATAGGIGTEGPNGGPSNDPEIAYGVSDLGVDTAHSPAIIEPPATLDI